MSKAVTPNEARQNMSIVQAVINEFPKEVSGQAGIVALGKLADLMPHDDFLNFLHDALHHATTGEAPPQSDQEGEQQEPQGDGQQASPAPETA